MRPGSPGTSALLSPVSIPYRFNETTEVILVDMKALWFQFLIGSMRLEILKSAGVVENSFNSL